VVKLGDVSLDGTKIAANASKHKALSWAYAERLEQQLQAEVQTLLARAAAADGPGAVDLDLPAELQRREDRLAKIAEAKAEIERRAQARYARERAEYEAKQPNERPRSGPWAGSWAQKAPGTDPRSPAQGSGEFDRW